MDLILTTKFTKPKARLDPIFEMKREVIKFCSHLAFMRLTMPKCIPIAQTHPTTCFVTHKIKTIYYEYLQSRDFDERLFEAMDNMSVSEREGYKQVQFSDALLRLINGVKYKPTYLPAPLYWHNKEIRTMFESKFYARYETDCFNHKGIIMRENGVDYYFTKQDKKPEDRFPIFTQPFIVAKDVERHFTPYGSNFTENYRMMRGLFTLWYGFSF